MKLNTRIIIATTGLIILTTIGILFFVNERFRTTLENEHVRWSRTLLESLSQSTMNDLLERQPHKIRETLRRIVQSDSRIAYFVITDFKGQIFAHTFNGPIPKSVPADFKFKSEDSDWKVQIAKFDGQEITDTRHRLVKDVKAMIRVGVSRKELTESINAANQEILAVSLLALIIGTIIAVVIARTITRPISSLSNGIESYKRGRPLALPHFKYLDPETNQLLHNFSEMVDEKTQFETAMKLEQERLQVAQRMGQIGDWSTNLATGEVTWSQEIFRIFGMEPDQIKNDLDFFVSAVVPEDRQAYMDARNATLDQGAVFKIEVRIKLTDDRLKFIHCRGEVEKDSNGKPFRFFGTVQDISERKRAEAALKKAYDELEDRVEERTLELQREIIERKLAEKSMHDAVIQADSANRSKSEFLANMSHELRTPLNAIIGFSETLSEKIFGPLGSEKQEEYIDYIHQSGQHLLNLINDILDVSAIEADKLDLNETDVDIEDVVTASVLLVKPRAEQGGIELINTINGHRLVIRADERRMKQVLVNLLSNAVKFTKEGGTVTVGADVDEDGSTTISVADTGIGMSAEDITRAMELFGQVRQGDSKEHEGTGLGLPLTNRLVEAQGGCLLIESEPGIGTTVNVKFPKDKVAQSK